MPPRNNDKYSVGKLVDRVKALTCDICEINDLKEVTFEELLATKETGTFKVGTGYLLTDFRNNHLVPNDPAGKEAIDTPLKPPIEQLVIIPLSSSEISAQAFSLDYPQDIIYYDITADWLGTLKPTTHTGAIMRRIDTDSNVELPGDWRTNVLWRGELDLDPYGGNGLQYVLWAPSVTTVGADINNTYANRVTPLTLNYTGNSKYVNTFDPTLNEYRSILINSTFSQTSPIPNIHFSGLDAVDVRIQTFNDGMTVMPVSAGFRHFNSSFCQANIFAGAEYHFAEFNGIMSNNFFTVGFRYFYPLVNCTNVSMYTGPTTHATNPGGASLWTSAGVHNYTDVQILVEGLGGAGNADSINYSGDGVRKVKLSLDQSILTKPVGTFARGTVRHHQLQPVPEDFVTKFYAMDLSTQTNKNFISGVASDIEHTETLTGATPLNLVRFKATNADYTSWCAGVWNFTGTGGTYTVNTFEAYDDGADHPIILKPAAGITLSIPYNDVANGFVQSETVTANGTSGQMIFLETIGDRWVARSSASPVATLPTLTNHLVLVGQGTTVPMQDTGLHYDDATNILSVNQPGSKTAFYLDKLAVTGTIYVADDTGRNNVGVGVGTFNTFGVTRTYNVAIGYGVMFGLTSGSDNVGIGDEACSQLTTGYGNIGIGPVATYLEATGDGNIGIGVRARFQPSDGDYNIAIGYEACYSNSNQTHNRTVVIGPQAFYAHNTGDDTVAIGYRAGGYSAYTNNETSVYLGALATPGATTGISNEMVLGYNVTGNGSNTATYGNSSMTDHIFTNGMVWADELGINRAQYGAGTNNIAATDPTIIEKTAITVAGDTMNLPSGTATDKIFIIKDTSGNAGTDNITVATAGTELIDGAATAVINANYGVLRVYFDGTNYFTI